MIDRRNPSRRLVLQPPPSGDGDGPPDAANLLFWGDCASPLTVIAAGAVATLGDASGNGRSPTQATASMRPTYALNDAQFGGKSSMTFDGVDDMLEYAATPVPAQTGATFYCVYTLNAASGGTIVAVGPSNDARAGLGLFTDSFFGVYAAPSAAETSAALADPSTVGTPLVAAATIDAAAGGDCVIAYRDGTPTGAPLATAAEPGTTPSASLYIGGDAGGTASITVACALVYSGIHDAARVAAVTSWLQAEFSL